MTYVIILSFMVAVVILLAVFAAVNAFGTAELKRKFGIK